MTDLSPPWSGQTEWHRARWGWWGWAETAPKLVAILLAIGAAIAGGGAWSVPSSHRLSFWLLTAAALGYVFAAYDRWLDKEIVAMGFVVLMIAGHWAMVFVMGRSDWPGSLVQLFAGFMLLGDLIKIGYFATTKARVKGMSPAVPIAMTSVLAAAYLVALLAA